MRQTYYIPDAFVVPTRLVLPKLGVTNRLEIYEESLPFIAEIWSRSTGAYDVEAKIPEYVKRGDLEIWLASLSPTGYRLAPAGGRFIHRIGLSQWQCAAPCASGCDG